MSKSRFFYLYLVAGLIAVALLVFNLLSSSPGLRATSIFIEVVLAILFLYLANKTWHEKRDKDLM